MPCEVRYLKLVEYNAKASKRWSAIITSKRVAKPLAYSHTLTKFAFCRSNNLPCCIVIQSHSRYKRSFSGSSAKVADGRRCGQINLENSGDSGHEVRKGKTWFVLGGSCRLHVSNKDCGKSLP